MTTPHINAEKGDFAETVLLPGDPLRAKYIAETFLENAQQVNDIRNMLGFTGTYKGQQISVMGHGMGIPSCSIYCHELVVAFDVKKLIRVGSCGAISNDVRLKDIVIAMGASTDSKVNRVRFRDHDLAAIADYQLLRNAVDTATDKNLSFHVGNIFSADLFYTPEPEMIEVMKKYKILAMEMEAAGIYSLAMALGAQALTICTVSDHILTGEKLTAGERQSGFSEMIELALDSSIL